MPFLSVSIFQFLPHKYFLIKCKRLEKNLNIYTGCTKTLLWVKTIITSSRFVVSRIFYHQRKVYHYGSNLQQGDTCLKFHPSHFFFSFFLLQKFYIVFYSSYVSICKDLQKTIVLSSGPFRQVFTFTIQCICNLWWSESSPSEAIP